jgi:hypothetical protein
MQVCYELPSTLKDTAHTKIMKGQEALYSSSYWILVLTLNIYENALVQIGRYGGGTCTIILPN